jgi:uncharacterized protein (TIGR03083 family)
VQREGRFARIADVEIWSSAPHGLRSSIESERRELLDLLRSIPAEEWRLPTPAARWRVRDVALHLLDDDLGWLSRGRDGDLTSLIPMDVPYRKFVSALDEKNQRWVDAAQGLSQRVVTDLLEWSGEQVVAYYDALRAGETTSVMWAGGEAPQWLGVGRDFTERWVHQQQIREAVARAGENARYLPVVLAIFAWAFPHQVEAPAVSRSAINIDLGDGIWHLTWDEHRWTLHDGAAGAPAAAIAMDSDTAWRQLTGARITEGKIRTSGDSRLVKSLLAVRGIIV